MHAFLLRPSFQVEEVFVFCKIRTSTKYRAGSDLLNLTKTKWPEWEKKRYLSLFCQCLNTEGMFAN